MWKHWEIWQIFGNCLVEKLKDADRVLNIARSWKEGYGSPLGKGVKPDSITAIVNSSRILYCFFTREGPTKNLLFVYLLEAIPVCF